MALPPVPKYEPVPMVESDPIPAFKTLTANVMTLWKYMQTLRNSFTNATGEAMDPTNGGAGGGGSIDILTPPGSIVFTPGVDFNTSNQTAEGFIDIAFTLPAHAVGVEVFWREQGGTTDKQSYANTSPYRLLYLQPGVTYTLSLAGEAANGALGPSSVPDDVTVPVGSSNTAPADAHYVVTEVHPRLTVEHVLGVQPALTLDNSPGNAILDIAVGGVTTVKLADGAVTDAKLRPSTPLSVIGRSANSTGSPADIAAASGNGHFLVSNGTALLWQGAATAFTLTVTGFATAQTVVAYAARYGRLATFVIVSSIVTGGDGGSAITFLGMPALYLPEQNVRLIVPMLVVNGGSLEWAFLEHPAGTGTTWNLTPVAGFTPGFTRGFYPSSYTYITDP